MGSIPKIVISDDKKKSGSEQGHSRPLKLDYSYQDRDTMNDAVVTASPAHKRKSLADGESVMVWTFDVMFFFG